MAKHPLNKGNSRLEPPDDPAAVAEADLWFLPAAEAGDAADPPWPVAPHGGDPLTDPAAWRAAEAAEYRAVVAAATALARFGERLRGFPAAGTERFALQAAAAGLRAEGLWLGPERIALHMALRGGAGTHARDLGRAAWAVRRLSPSAPAPASGLRGFRGLAAAGNRAPLPGPMPPRGDALDAIEEDWAARLAAVGDCHPLTRAALALALWQALEVTPPEARLEPAVAAQRIGGGTHAPFVPAAPGAGPPPSGPPQARLAGFCAQAEAGALAGLMQLDRLDDWAIRARAATADLAGRVPPRLVDAFLALPAVSADLAAARTGASRAAARRNLKLLTDRGLIREMTGQDRYRFWTARL